MVAYSAAPLVMLTAPGAVPAGDAGDRGAGLRPHGSLDGGVAGAGDVPVGGDVAGVSANAAVGRPVAGGGVAAQLDEVESDQSEAGRHDGGNGDGRDVARAL